MLFPNSLLLETSSPSFLECPGNALRFIKNRKTEKGWIISKDVLREGLKKLVWKILLNSTLETVFSSNISKYQHCAAMFVACYFICPPRAMFLSLVSLWVRFSFQCQARHKHTEFSCIHNTKHTYDNIDNHYHICSSFWLLTSQCICSVCLLLPKNIRFCT